MFPSSAAAQVAPSVCVAVCTNGYAYTNKGTSAPSCRTWMDCSAFCRAQCGNTDRACDRQGGSSIGPDVAGTPEGVRCVIDRPTVVPESVTGTRGTCGYQCIGGFADSLPSNTPQVVQQCVGDNWCQDLCHITCAQQATARCAGTAPRCIATPGRPTSTVSGGTGGSAGTSARLDNPLGVTTWQGLIGKLIRALIGVAGSIALAAFVWGGVLYMTARGEGDQVQQAKEILINAVIGLVLIFFSYSIIATFLNIFTTTATS